MIEGGGRCRRKVLQRPRPIRSSGQADPPGVRSRAGHHLEISLEPRVRLQAIDDRADGSIGHLRERHRRAQHAAGELRPAFPVLSRSKRRTHYVLQNRTSKLLRTVSIALIDSRGKRSYSEFHNVASAPTIRNSRLRIEENLRSRQTAAVAALSAFTPASACLGGLRLERYRVGWKNGRRTGLARLPERQISATARRTMIYIVQRVAQYGR